MGAKTPAVSAPAPLAVPEDAGEDADADGLATVADDGRALEAEAEADDDTALDAEADDETADETDADEADADEADPEVTEAEDAAADDAEDADDAAVLDAAPELAPRHPELLDVWIVKGAELLVSPCASWMEKMSDVPEGWLTTQGKGELVAELEISSTRFWDPSRRRMSKGPVPPVQLIW